MGQQLDAIAIPAPLITDITQAALRFGLDALIQYEARTSREKNERELAERLREAEREIRIELGLPSVDADPQEDV